MSVNGRLRDLERAVPRRMRSGCSRCDDLRRKWVWIYLVLKADLRACPECGGDVDLAGNPIGLHGDRSKAIVLVIEPSRGCTWNAPAIDGPVAVSSDSVEPSSRAIL